MSKEKKEIVTHKKCLYPYLRNLEVSEVHEYFLYRQRDDNFDCNFDVIDNKTKKLLLSKRATSCFNTLTSVNSKNERFSKVETEDLSLNLFICKSEMGISDKNFKRFIRLVRKIGKFKFKTLKNYSLEQGSLPSDYYTEIFKVSLRKPETVYCFTINYNDYKNLEHLKLLLYTIRISYEFNQYKSIDAYFKYLDKNPKAPFLSLLYGYFNSLILKGHKYQSPFRIDSDKDFLESWFKANDVEYDAKGFSRLRKSGIKVSYEIKNSWANLYYPSWVTIDIQIENIKFSDLDKIIRKRISELITKFEEDKNYRSIKVEGYEY